ncbi:MAG TPA: DUF934 domain-containing protein [Burkholderiales bacterium]|nr:DUF934 domain-containing protein [Burkholderiales bacterium]
MATLIRNRQIVQEPSPPPDLAVLEPGDDPSVLAGRLPGLKVVAVNFPKYGDGRGYSIGRLLRERYGYRGELRAVGAVARDHLQLLARCGFDCFQLREGEDPQEALRGLDDFSESYQASAAQPVPLFRRRIGR